MRETHDNFDKAISDLRFRQSRKDNLKWLKVGSYRDEYELRFEGYAYVLYKRFSLYGGFFIPFLFLWNKSVRSREIKTYYEVPLAHFRDPEKLRTFWEILNDKLGDEGVL
jgi:hypothetical protein